MRPRLLSALSLIVLAFAGCTSAPTGRGPQPAAALEPATPPSPEPAGTATIRGSQESSAMLDNFTAFITAVDEVPVTAGREGWDTPVKLDAGPHTLTVEFRRGVFSARARLEMQAAPRAKYQVNYTTDAQLFGHNSYCDFWIVDLATGRSVTAVAKAAVVKGG